MQTQNNNEKSTYGIEKFEGNFDKEEFGVTIIPNKTINEITNIEALGLYVFLLARPHGWKLNVNHLKDHFKLGRDKIRKILNWLLDNKYISCTVTRESGRFSKPHYRVHLHSHNLPTPVINTEFTPETEIQAPVNPSTVDQYAYKTKNTFNKENNNNTPTQQAGKNKPVPSLFSGNTPRLLGTNPRAIGTNPRAIGTNPRAIEKITLYSSDRFIEFWNLYPVKKSRKNCEIKWRRLNLDIKADIILLALKNQIENDRQWERGFIPNPLTYLNGELWNDEIVKTKSHGKKSEVSYC